MMRGNPNPLRQFASLAKQFEEMVQPRLGDQQIGQFNQDDYSYGRHYGLPERKIDVAETDEEVRVTVDVPGYEPDDITISVDDDGRYLDIQGERSVDSSDDQHYHGRSEKISSRIPLPSQVEKDAAEAEYKNGVLSVFLPKKTISSDDGNVIEIEWDE